MTTHTKSMPPLRSELAALVQDYGDAVRTHALAPTEANNVAVRAAFRAVLTRFAHTLPDGVWQGTGT